eukprot:7181210-Prymnesium_polylepis.1
MQPEARSVVRSLRTRSTACGRQVLSLGSAWWRSSDQRALLLHPPDLRCRTVDQDIDATAADCL